MRYTDGVGWGAWLVMVMVMLVFWGAIAAVAITVIRQSGSRPSAPAANPNPGRGEPMRILEERFARGDIDEDEFRRRRDVLRDST